MKHNDVTVDVMDEEKKISHYAHSCIEKSCNLENILCTKAASAPRILARKKTQWGKKNQCFFHRV